MKRESFILHILEGCGCTLVREDNQGYFVVRNPVNGKMSGIPKANINGDIRPVTVCKICNQLNIIVPDAVKHVQPIIDLIEKTLKE